jgi:uncharacterized protein
MGQIVSCSMPSVSELYIYPVKSLGGVRVKSAELTDRGFQYDRRWMLVDVNNEFLTQREHPKMALLQASVIANGIQVVQKNNSASTIIIPFQPSTDETMTVKIWDDFCEATRVADEADQWFSDTLQVKCKLVHMADNSLRKVDERYAVHEKDVTSFADAYPVLIIGKESLEDLNNRLPQPLPMNRFRPNIVLEGSEPYEEDVMEQFTINGVNFFGVKLCDRCVMTTINQDTAGKNKEPLKTLARYRMRDNNIYFGQNVLYEGTGTIKTGDKIEIVKRKAKPVFVLRD